ncbi:hypothetical protein [Streptomyces umbrinus]|uniref:hypothetical protein n=1 Tax=Streptomyces umbrinus TaxID=67370 RepID=UPI0033D6E558
MNIWQISAVTAEVVLYLIAAIPAILCIGLVASVVGPTLVRTPMRANLGAGQFPQVGLRADRSTPAMIVRSLVRRLPGRGCFHADRGPRPRAGAGRTRVGDLAAPACR